MWTIENRDDAIEFIRNHIDAMEEGMYAWLYSLIEPSYFGIPIFTQVLWSLDIHPEEEMQRIPPYFAYMVRHPVTSVKLSPLCEALELECFASSTISGIEIPPSVTLFSDLLFSGSHLQTFHIPDNQSAIHFSSEICSQCKFLEEVALGEGVVTLGPEMFSQCAVLQRVSLPASLRRVGDSIFAHTPQLTELQFNGPIGLWKRVSRHKNWANKSSIQHIVCTDGAINVGDPAF